MNPFKGLLGAVLVILLIPLALVITIWGSILAIVLTPFAIVGFLIWRLIKAKGWIKPKVEIPKDAKPYVPPPPRKPIMVTWQGRKIPLGVFIFSAIMSIILLPIILFLIIFVIPPLWTILVLGFMSGRAIGKKKRRRKCLL